MAKSQETFNKKEKEKKRLKKKQDKLKKKEERKSHKSDGSLESMIAYVDENGRITDTPPDETKKQKVDVNSIEIGVPKKEDIEEDPIKKGKIEFYNNDKGYGFIKELESGDKFFFHINNVVGDIQDNSKVEFELEQGARGLVAVSVKEI